jgi:hypothetical protein
MAPLEISVLPTLDMADEDTIAGESGVIPIGPAPDCSRLIPPGVRGMPAGARERGVSRAEPAARPGMDAASVVWVVAVDSSDGSFAGGLTALVPDD